MKRTGNTAKTISSNRCQTITDHHTYDNHHKSSQKLSFHFFGTIISKYEFSSYYLQVFLFQVNTYFHMNPKFDEKFITFDTRKLLF